MKELLEKAFPDLIWTYMCEDRPEMVGTGHKFRIEIDVLGENHYSVAVGTRIVGGFSYASTYTTKDPVDAINKAIDGAVEKADNCKTFLLTKKSLDRDANED